MRPSHLAGFLFFLAYFPAFCQQAVDSSATLIVRGISITGNKVTKEHIILRELEFLPGDTIPAYRLEEFIKRSENNLMNISLFNFAEIDAQVRDNGTVDFTIGLTERWYIWPFPFFEIAEPNFNTWWINKDFSRTSYGIYVLHDNMRGRKEELKFRLRLGFDEQLAAQYYFPYVNRKQTIGLQFTVGYSRNHEVNYKTFENKRQFFKSDDDYVRQEFFARARLTVRKRLYNTTTFIVQYNNAFIADTLTILSTDYFKDNVTHAQFLSASAVFKHDNRDYIHYPLKGYMFAAELKKEGLGFFSSGNLNLLTAYLNLHGHFQVDERLYFASAVKTKLNLLENPPYYLQQGFGYGNFVRGYEYYVMDGQNYGLVLTAFKLQVLKPRSGHVSWIKNERFGKYHFALYVNLFADAGYVVDGLYQVENPLSNEFLVGGGTGLHLVAYYDTVIRAEYSVNKLGESGIFLHFTKHI